MRQGVITLEGCVCKHDNVNKRHTLRIHRSNSLRRHYCVEEKKKTFVPGRKRPTMQQLMHYIMKLSRKPTQCFTIRWLQQNITDAFVAPLSYRTLPIPLVYKRSCFSCQSGLKHAIKLCWLEGKSSYLVILLD